MIVQVHVRSKTLQISIGNGNQTFKWLALVISGRLKHFHVLKHSFEDECRTVTALKDGDGRLLNPSDIICETVPNHAEIYADVTDKIESDEYGNPLLTDWMMASFTKSDHGLKWISEMDAWRNHTKEDEEEPNQGSLLFVGKFTIDEIDSAFDLDWRIMNWKWLGFMPSDSEVHDIKILLKSNYSVICKIFSHYCGLGKVGERYGLTLNEFGHFIHCTKALSYKANFKRLEPIFVAVMSHDNDDEGGSSVNLMSRVEFVYALIRVAINGLDYSLEQIREYLVDQVDVCWADVLSRYHIYNTDDALLLKTFEEYFEPLKSLFLDYSDVKRGGPGLTYPTFKEMLIRSTLVSPTQDALCKSAFGQGQHIGNISIIQMGELDEIVFSEFLEALCIIGRNAIKDEDISTAQKIRMTFATLCENLQ